MTRRYLMKNLPKVIKGTHENLPEIKIIKTKKVTVEATEALSVEYDGEILRGQKKLEISLRPGLLKVIGN